jgi:osmoprotectant transport system ATP-binding protein
VLRLAGVTKRYDDGTVAVDSLDLSVEAGEVCVLVGPSGSGKTTTLRLINRLIEPTSGRIFLDGADVTTVDPVELRRRMGYVIQHVGLFPHLTIEANVGAVPRLLGWDKNRVRARVMELLELVGLDAARHARRYPAELSGGQRQRAGVARALAADPPVLLMDEPFGAIDPITRDRLQTEFMRLQHELRKTVVLVTHDIEEAVRLADRIALLADGGKLAQYDTPAQLLGAPSSDFVASFVGADRNLKRLGVTPIVSISGVSDGSRVSGVSDASGAWGAAGASRVSAASGLEAFPVVPAQASMAQARETVIGSGGRWGIVVDHDCRMVGHVAASDLAGEGKVGDVMRSEPGSVSVSVEEGATLRDALALMLSRDEGWVAVLERGRYLGVLTPASLHAALRRSVAEGGAG